MKIAIDFEGTLIPECSEFPVERRSELARLLFPFALRRGAREFLRDLSQAGHELTLYTRLPVSVKRLRLWCHLNRLPFRHVILRTHLPESGDWIGQDLVLDDDSLFVAAAHQAGRKALLVTNWEDDWVAPLRKAILTPSGSGQLCP